MIPSEQQQAVIDHPLLPLRVVAGAGAGKTATMALRLARFVAAGEVEPEQALGITFTNKAAAELADRVRAELPEQTADGLEVEVTTYHGFAHRLLREFGPLVGVPREVRVITPGYTRHLMRGATAGAASPLLDLTQPGRISDHLARLASSLGDHLCSARDLMTGLDGDIAAERDALADVLVEYESRKLELGVVDFADLVTLAYRLVSENPSVAQRICDRYRIVLLDEYQDTNPGQRLLLMKIFSGGFPVTAVGDTDQTIYEWRGASLENFEAFPSHFPDRQGRPAASLALSTTWRNDADIVDVANEVRGRLRNPGPLPRLTARDGAQRGRVVTHWERSAATEAAWIADEAARLHEGGTPWSEIAILFRKHRQISAVRDALEERDIPFEVASLGGLLEVPEVVDLHSWLRLLGRPDDAVALARILTGSRYRLGLGDLAPLATWVKAQRNTSGDDIGLGWALLEAVDDLESVEGLSGDAQERLESFRAAYRSLLLAAQSVSLVELCRAIMDETGAWLEIEALGDPRRLSTRLNLSRFLDLAEEWSPLDGTPSLEGFLDYLDLLADETTSGELDTARVSGEDAIPLLTVHRAKGLEWDAVFLPALAEKVFPSSVVQYEDPLTVAWVLPRRLRLDAEHLPAIPDDDQERKQVLREAHDDQEWRAAYVAVTRARHALYGSGAFWTGGSNPRKPSSLFALIDDLAEEAPGRAAEAGERPGVGDPTRCLPSPDPVFPDGWKSALVGSVSDLDWPARRAAELGVSKTYDRLVDQLRLDLRDLPTPRPEPEANDRFATSVTGLVTVATCPLRFRWSEIERLPRRPSTAARRGVELHRRIELHNRGSMAFEEADIALYDAVGEQEERVESAFELFLKSRFAAHRPLLVEAPFTLLVDNCTVSGRIDAVYGASDHWEVVDFKSGVPRNDPARRVQLQSYALAIDESGMAGNGRPDGLTVTFVFLGGGELTEISEQVGARWLASARTDIADLLAQARSDEHPATPSAACRTCDFAHLCTAGTEWLEANP